MNKAVSILEKYFGPYFLAVSSLALFIPVILAMIDKTSEKCAGVVGSPLFLLLRSFAVPSALKEKGEDFVQDYNLTRKKFLDKLLELIRKSMPDDEKAHMPAFELVVDVLSNIVIPMFMECKAHECGMYMNKMRKELKRSLDFVDCIMQSLALNKLLCCLLSSQR